MRLKIGSSVDSEAMKMTDFSNPKLIWSDLVISKYLNNKNYSLFMIASTSCIPAKENRSNNKLEFSRKKQIIRQL